MREHNPFLSTRALYVETFGSPRVLAALCMRHWSQKYKRQRLTIAEINERNQLPF